MRYFGIPALFLPWKKPACKPFPLPFPGQARQKDLL